MSGFCSFFVFIHACKKFHHHTQHNNNSFIQRNFQNKNVFTLSSLEKLTRIVVLPTHRLVFLISLLPIAYAQHQKMQRNKRNKLFCVVQILEYIELPYIPFPIQTEQTDGISDHIFRISRDVLYTRMRRT